MTVVLMSLLAIGWVAAPAQADREPAGRGAISLKTQNATTSRDAVNRAIAKSEVAREAARRMAAARRALPTTGSSTSTSAVGSQDGPDPNSCVGFCGGQAPGGCFCDEACCSFLDCCPDKFAACGGCDPGGGGGDPNSCVGFCGGQAPGGCFCDEACCSFLDCCADKFAACGGCDPGGGGGDPLSCEGFCGGQAPGGCFCDEACCDFLDCCADKFKVCGGCNPGGPAVCDPVPCPPGALAEGEPCGSDTNGGCNSTPNVFSPIACGDTYCGVAWADGGTRDTDWYKLVLANNSTVTLSGTAEFPLLIGIVNNNGVDSCAGVSQFLAFATANANAPATVSASLSAGTWYLFVGNQGFSGNPCGACNAYVFSVACVCGGGGGNCPADVTGDGNVGVNDLLAVITAWGPCACCAADINGDGNVGVSDLLAVITNWGPCPADPNSCVGFCGGQAPGGCFCDEACCSFLDCCADKFEACGGCDPGGGGDPLSCVGFCGGQAPGGCFCDEACCSFLDCCADKFAACGGCNPGGPAVCDPVPCPPGALAEGEPCGSDTNGGCNSTPPVFSPIACGDTYCGVAWADGGTRDTDWYKLVLTEVTTVTLTGTAEFPLLIGVVNNNGVDSCAGVSSFLAFATGPANTTVTVTTALNPGTWYLFAGNSGFSGNPCGACNAYTLNLACTPGGDPGDPNSCVGFCGGQAPGGCFCDEACCSFLDCCADKFAACGGCDPGGGGGDPLSCVGFCGGQAPGGCFCDEACCSFLDCCADKFAACGGCDPGGGGGDPLSCVGFCGGQAPGGCFCDEACCSFTDCCADKVAACGGCSP